MNVTIWDLREGEALSRWNGEVPRKGDLVFVGGMGYEVQRVTWLAKTPEAVVYVRKASQ